MRARLFYGLAALSLLSNLPPANAPRLIAPARAESDADRQRAEEARRKEDERRRKEDERKREDEERKREDERQRQDADLKRRQEQQRRDDEARRRQEEQRRAEEVRRQQDERKRLEAKAKADEAARKQELRQRAEDARRYDEALRRANEARKQEEERAREAVRRAQEDAKAEQRRLDDARKDREEDDRRLQELQRQEDEARRLAAEIRRKETEERQSQSQSQRLDSWRTLKSDLSDQIRAMREHAPPTPVAPPPAEPSRAATPPTPRSFYCGSAQSCDETLMTTAMLGACLFAQPATLQQRTDSRPCHDGAAFGPVSIRMGQSESYSLSTGLVAKFNRARNAVTFSDGQSARRQANKVITFADGLTVRPDGRALVYSNGVTASWDRAGRLVWHNTAYGTVTLGLHASGPVFGSRTEGTGWPCRGAGSDPAVCARVMTDMAQIAGATFAGGTAMCPRTVEVSRVAGFQNMTVTSPDRAGARLSTGASIVQSDPDQLRIGNDLTVRHSGPDQVQCSNGVTARIDPVGGLVFSTGVTARLESPGHVVLSNGLRLEVDGKGRVHVGE